MMVPTIHSFSISFLYPRVKAKLSTEIKRVFLKVYDILKTSFFSSNHEI